MSQNDQLRIQYIGNTPSSNVPIMSLIIISTIINILLYKILPSSLSPFLKSHIISTIHAFISVVSVVNFFFKYEINFKQINRILGGGISGTGDEIMVYSVCYSTGYLIYDLFLMFIYKSVRNNSAIVHHIVILISILLGLYSKVGHSCHFYYLAEELSTIPLNLKTIYRNQPRLHHIFSLLFVASFFLSRLFYGSIIFFYAFRAAPQFLKMAWNFHDITSFLIAFIQAILCILTRLLNIYWALLILKKIFSKNLSEKKKKSS
ncbi:unnamed protein product [Adineta steineri]|uniref:TLC domain-containing protein n=1 Tax=Adineta steineri TaxID=433720 RepID=A0A819YDG1_9BILA|nr:unnamed protein product [Adineta steineri]CAF4153285.1 unnamed protein product [Adineta steineri]